jgi:hypothetical protein
MSVTTRIGFTKGNIKNLDSKIGRSISPTVALPNHNLSEE